MTVKTHRFNGVKYDIHLNYFEGWCDPPSLKGENPDLVLPQGLPFGNEKRAKLGLITLIHECLHATKYPGKEKDVDRASTEIGSLLWRLGYRRVVTKKPTTKRGKS